MESLGREVLRLAVPAFGALVAPSLLMLTDAAFIGSLGTDALAGYAGAAAVFGIAVSLGYFLAYASTSVVARRFGAGQPREAVAEGINYITLGLIIGAGIGVIVWTLSPTFVDWVGVADSAVPHAIDWIRAGAFGSPFMMASMAAIGMFRGLQDTKVTFYVTLLTVGINMVLAAIFIFALGLGTWGAGIAFGVAETVGFLAYLVALLRYARSIGAPMYPTHIGGIGNAFRIALPLLWRSFAMRVVFAGSTVVAARIGTEELAAFHVSLQIWYVLSNLLDAVAIAGQAIIGKRLGASQGHLVHDIVNKLIRWSMMSAVLIGALTLMSAFVAPPLFTDDPVVRSLLFQCIIIVAVHQPLAALVFLLDGVLIGSGDTKYLAQVITYAMLVFLVISWAVLRFDLGVLGLWCAMIGFLTTRVVFLYSRARGDAWIVEGATR